MKVPLRWLSEYVELPTEDSDELERALAALGHEVEGRQRLELPFAGVVTARVEERKPHPNADRLQLVRVMTGKGEAEVVCGAWNFDVGDLVPYAPPGSTLAGGLAVGEREIRGITSPGMICSEAELGLGDDSTGILVLGSGAKPGTDLGEIVPLPDEVFDVSITPNRPDCMSMVGLARELSAFYQATLRLPPLEPAEEASAGRVEVRIEDPAGCPRYVAREVHSVDVGPSPSWIRLRLLAAGTRPVNNVVDVTNYVLLELGQPLHAFDLDTLGGGAIVVRRAREGEVLTTLDGIRRELRPEDLVIADAERPVALAGVMGGEETEVGEGTRRVLIESAHFDPSTVLLTAHRHGLRTEASARFERGVDPNGAMAAADRAARIMEQVAGGAAAAEPRDVYPAPVRPVRVELPLSEVPRLLGIELRAEEVSALLARLQLGVEGRDPLVVTVPTFRPDLTRPADLVEEVARMHGYDRIPETMTPGTGGGLPEDERRRRLTRSIMTGGGYFEAQTFSFLGQQDLDRLLLPHDDPRRLGIAVVNPLREEEGVLRTTLLPGLLRAAAYNRGRRLTDLALFELGRVFLPEGDELPEQPERLAFVALGSRGSPPHEELRPVDAFDATGTWERLAAGLGLTEAAVRPGGGPPFHPGRSAQALLGGRAVGTVGELHPAVVRAFDLEGRVVAGEIALEPLLREPPWRQLAEPSPYPPVIFDLAFELDEDVPAGELLDVVREAGRPVVESVMVFDVFRGEPLPTGRKSLALRLTCRAPDHTLTDEEVAPVRRAVAEAVAGRLGGRLRGA